MTRSARRAGPASARHYLGAPGRTGSGKTTTLYSTLKRVATEEVNVSTSGRPD